MSLRDIPIDDTLLNPEESGSHKTILPQEVQVSTGNELRCKICFETSKPLVSCCECAGSIGYVHENCLLEWMAHCIEKSGYSATPRCEICKANISATISVSKPEFSIARFLTLTQDKKLLLTQIIFSIVAILLAILQSAVFILNFNMREGFTGMVLPAFVILHSIKFLAGQTIWSRCFMQVVEVTLDPYDIIR